jgi:hypothetical protein
MKTYTDIERIKILFLSDTLFDPQKAIEELLPCRITNEIFEFILATYYIESELYAGFIGRFIIDYNHLNGRQQSRLKKYIREQISKNPLDSYFLYDLLDAATSWDMVDFYNDCLDFIEKYAKDDILVLAALSYIFENTSLYEVPNVIKTFEKVCEDPNYIQNCQVAATFYLYRWTQKAEYLDFLKELIDFNTSDNDKVLRNLLSEYAHQPAYFAMHDELMKWVKKK